MAPFMKSYSLAAVGLLTVGFLGCDQETGTTEDNATALASETTLEAQAVRALVNDSATTKEILVSGKVTKATAANILKHRDGADAAARTADDDLYDTLQELDVISGVGPATYKNLVKLATDRGYLAAQQAKKRSVIFSPQAADKTHAVEIAKIIGTATKSIDIAMYSYSDAGIQKALDEAVKRGVKVRFVFETASEDRKLTGTALTNSKSGRLETIGVDVRWVNKIMHHKFMIVDGPRDEAEAAKTATIVSGSANWSSGAGTKYDENTMYLTAYPELTLRLQRDFNTLWEHSKDLVSNPALTFEASSLVITDEMIPQEPGTDIFFTSNNFTVNGSTFSGNGKNTLADQLVSAIENAETRIHIASGHMRSRPVAEALMKKAAESPEVDIMIYLDGQEYISESGNTQQEADQQTCLASANTESKKRACLDKSFLYGLEIERAGANVRYKYYAYRWDAGYAAQMHNKVFIIDDTLFSGSYNLSDNAEHATFENMFMFRGPEFRDLVKSYEDRFQTLWVQGDGLLEPLRAKIDTDSTIPIVFPGMSLSWTEVRDLKSLIAKECPAVNSAPFRDDPVAHQVCAK